MSNSYIKSPINWVGNKFKHLNIINDLIKDKKYSFVLDMFLGSGNVLLNLQCNSDKYIGNDKNKLVPMLYGELKKYTYNLDKFEEIINRFNRFSDKSDYYTFRDYWNKKYLSNIFDEEFIYETVMLLKMCSNSMVRFNPKEGYFNQGFRGISATKKNNEFFTDTMKSLCVDGLNELSKHLNKNDYRFMSKDFITYEDKWNNGLLICDPPYILRKDMYDTDFSENHDVKLLDIISNTKNDFIYFNYLVSNGEVNETLNKIIKENNYKVMDINNKSLAGQGRSQNIKEVQEVIVTNV